MFRFTIRDLLCSQHFGQVPWELGCLLCLIIGGCSFWSSPTKIEFVLPVGFKGPFVTVKEPDGQSCKPKHGKLVLEVPESGVLTIKDDRVFGPWHRLGARYADGTPLPIEVEAPKNAVALRL